MATQKWIALILIMGGALALAYGGFSYTKQSHKAELGPVNLTVDETERVNIPAWLGGGAILLGGLLLVLPRRS